MEKLIKNLTWMNLVNKLKVILTELSKGSGETNVSSDNITDATAIGKNIITADSASSVRTLIGAGTSNLALGTTASTAKAGNYVPTWGEVTGKPAFLTIGTTSTTAAAGNHTHSVATSSAIGFMSTADKIKLDNIATGATANDTDANLLNRANHTGTQPFTTLSGVATAAQIPALPTSKITSGTFNIAQTNSVLAGYAVGTAGPIAATDTLLQALGKLEARLVALETA